MRIFPIRWNYGHVTIRAECLAAGRGRPVRSKRGQRAAGGWRQFGPQRRNIFPVPPEAGLRWLPHPAEKRPPAPDAPRSRPGREQGKAHLRPRPIFSEILALESLRIEIARRRAHFPKSASTFVNNVSEFYRRFFRAPPAACTRCEADLRARVDVAFASPTAMTSATAGRPATAEPLSRAA